MTRTCIICDKCGLVGCTCPAPELAEAFDHLCKRCKTDPCECAGKVIKRTVGERDVCLVCRRQQNDCICVSHVSVRHSFGDPAAINMRPTRPYGDSYIGQLVNEGMVFYYNRDADGLSRWLRRVLG